MATISEQSTSKKLRILSPFWKGPYSYDIYSCLLFLRWSSKTYLAQNLSCRKLKSVFGRGQQTRWYGCMASWVIGLNMARTGAHKKNSPYLAGTDSAANIF